MVHEPLTFHGGLDENAKIQKTKDGLLETRVAGELAVTSGVETPDVSVVANGHTVHLAGYVTDEIQAERAEDIAKSVDGVDNVISTITVGKAGRG